MLKNKLATAFGAVFLLVAFAPASAVNLEEFSAKNRQLLSLKTDLEIVKSEQAIKKEKDGRGDGSNASLPPLPSGDLQSRASNNGEPTLNSVSGDVNNPQVEFLYQGSELPPVSKGATIINDWRLVSVSGRTVVIQKGKSGARKTLYLAGGASTAGMSRYDAPAGSSQSAPAGLSGISGMASPPAPSSNIGFPTGTSLTK